MHISQQMEEKFEADSQIKNALDYAKSIGCKCQNGEPPVGANGFEYCDLHTSLGRNHAIAHKYNLERIETLESILKKLTDFKFQSDFNDKKIEISIVELSEYINTLKKENNLPCYFLFGGPYVSFKEAAKKAQISNSILKENDIRNAARRGQFRTWLSKGRLYILESDLVKLIEENGVLSHELNKT